LTVTVLVMAMVVAVLGGWRKSSSRLVKLLTRVVLCYCYLLKTVLMIPLLIIVLIAIVPSVAA
jgi:hypothetical protein